MEDFSIFAANCKLHYQSFRFLCKKKIYAIRLCTSTSLTPSQISESNFFYSAEGQRHLEESMGLWSARSMKGQRSVNTLICEFTVSKVTGHQPVCGAAVVPDRLISLYLIAQLQPAQMVSKGKQSHVSSTKTSQKR